MAISFHDLARAVVAAAQGQYCARGASWQTTSSARFDCGRVAGIAGMFAPETDHFDRMGFGQSVSGTGVHLGRWWIHEPVVPLVRVEAQYTSFALTLLGVSATYRTAESSELGEEVMTDQCRQFVAVDDVHVESGRPGAVRASSVRGRR